MSRGIRFLGYTCDVCRSTFPVSPIEYWDLPESFECARCGTVHRDFRQYISNSVVAIQAEEREQRREP